MSLPSRPNLSDSAALDHALGLLLEPSPALHDLLVPRLVDSNSTLSTYSDLIDRCADEVALWTPQDKAVFLGGHPLIGEVKNLSAHSANEQGGGGRTPKVVLDRLAHLNTLYSHIFSGLPYITFVNARPRSAIVTEMETNLSRISSTSLVSPVPLPDDYPVDQPPLSQFSEVFSPGDELWEKECERALGDIWLIARSRLKGMGLR